MPALSDAVAPRATAPRTVAPAAGAVIATVGGALSTLTVTAVDVRLLPAASRATAVSECEPFVAVAVFHDTA